MPNFEDDSGNCHAPDPNGVACYKSRIGCPIHPRQKRKCHGGAKGQAMTDEKIAEIRDLHKYLDEYPNTDVSSGDLHHYLSFLLAEVERLRAALKPFAVEAEAYDPPEGDDAEPAWASRFTCGNLRDARKAWKGEP